MAALVDMQRGRTQLCIEGTRELIVLFGIMDRDLDVACLVIIGAKGVMRLFVGFLISARFLGG
jgi:hypothetical protein